MRRIRLAVLSTFVMSVVLAGCEKKPQELYVQVFVVTRGGNNVRLSLVQVNATPFEEAKSALNRTLASQRVEVGKLDAEIAKEKENFQGIAEHNKEELAAVNQTRTLQIRELDRATHALETAVKEIAAATRARVNPEGQHVADADYGRHQEQLEKSRAEISRLEYAAQISGLNASNTGYYIGVGNQVRTAVKNRFWEETPRERDAVLLAATDFENAAKALDVSAKQVGRLEAPPSRTAIDDLESQRASVLDPKALYNALPSPAESAKTDADGKCRLLLRGSRRWVVSASGGRHIPGGVGEDYIWR